MLDKLYITPRQWLRILRWTLYAALFLLALLVQTVVFGNRTILGAHPDLVAIVITCVCLREGPERGGTFALIACPASIRAASACSCSRSCPCSGASCAAPCWQTAFCRRCLSALSRLPWSRASSS